jgi:ribosomal protein L32
MRSSSPTNVTGRFPKCLAPMERVILEQSDSLAIVKVIFDSVIGFARSARRGRIGAMLDRLTAPESSRCPACGNGELRLLTGRVSKFEKTGGYINVFQCVSCGQIEHRDIPHDTPGKRT